LHHEFFAQSVMKKPGICWSASQKKQVSQLFGYYFSSCCFQAKRCAEELGKAVRLEFIDSDHSPTMLAGLGTLGLEILEQCDCKLDEVLVPASEETLLKALRYSIKSIFPHIRIIVAQITDKELTRVCSFSDLSDISDGAIQVRRVSH